MTRKKNNPANSSEEKFAQAEQYLLAAVAFVFADAMDRSGLSQKQLASRLNVSEARISQILNASGNPTVRSIARIAEALECKAQLKLINKLKHQESTKIHARGEVQEEEPIKAVHEDMHNVISWARCTASRAEWSSAREEVAAPSEEPLYAVF